MNQAPDLPLLRALASLGRALGGLDLERIRDLVRQFAEALEEPERIREFEALLSRSLGPES